MTIRHLCPDVLNEICLLLDDARSFLQTCKHVHQNTKIYRAKCREVYTLCHSCPQNRITWLNNYIRYLQVQFRIYELLILKKFLCNPVIIGACHNFFVLYGLISAKATLRKPRYAAKSIVFKFPQHDLDFVFVTGRDMMMARFSLACFVRKNYYNIDKKVDEYVCLMDHTGSVYPTRRMQALPNDMMYFLRVMIHGEIVTHLAAFNPGVCCMCSKRMAYTARKCMNPGLGPICMIRYMTAHRRAIFEFRTHTKMPFVDKTLLEEYNNYGT